MKLMQNVLILSDSDVVHTKGRRSAHVWIPGWPELPARVSQHPVPWCALTWLLPLKLDRSIGPWPISRVQQYCHDASGRWGNANTNSGCLSTCAFQAGHSSEPSKSLNFTLLNFFIYLASNKCFVLHYSCEVTQPSLRRVFLIWALYQIFWLFSRLRNRLTQTTIAMNHEHCLLKSQK